MWILYCCLRKGKEALRGEVKEGNRLDLPFYAILQTGFIFNKDKDKDKIDIEDIFPKDKIDIVDIWIAFSEQCAAAGLMERGDFLLREKQSLKNCSISFQAAKT